MSEFYCSSASGASLNQPAKPCKHALWDCADNTTSTLASFQALVGRREESLVYECCSRHWVQFNNIRNKYYQHSMQNSPKHSYNIPNPNKKHRRTSHAKQKLIMTKRSLALGWAYIHMHYVTLHNP